MSFPGKSLEASAENTVLGWMAHLDLSGRPVPKFLLTNGCLGQMNIHLFNGNTNGSLMKCCCWILLFMQSELIRGMISAFGGRRKPRFRSSSYH